MFISVVIPVYNESSNINMLYDELCTVFKDSSLDVEIIMVDDGSRDDSFHRIQSIASQDKRVKGISLSKNFGHQIALTAGLERSLGEAVITMDGDLQHPPQLIPSLIDKYKEGYDVVNTIRHETEKATFFKKASSFVFYKLINSLSDLHIQSGAADFRLMNRKCLNAFLALKERDRFTRGLVSWIGFNQAFISYSSPARKYGKSKYTFRKMFRFALDGITSFSARPLRFSLYLGIIVFIIGVIYACYALIKYFEDETVKGWASLLITVLVLGGIQLFTIGIIGEYLARVFNEAKQRPLYFIKDEIGFQVLKEA